MKQNIINIPRYCDPEKPHQLIQVEGNLYRFVPADDWMLIYVTKDSDEATITSIDCDSMGEPIYVGRRIGNKIVDEFILDGGFLVRLKDFS